MINKAAKKVGRPLRIFLGTMLCFFTGLVFAADQQFYFALPVEIETDFGADNGNARLLRIQPLYTFPRHNDWQLIHLNLMTFADAPGRVPGQPGSEEKPSSSEQKTGMSDLFHASFYTPARKGHFIWGIGGMMSFPTATDEALGSGKWTAGPALRLTYRTDKWNIGGFGGNHWSYAGSSKRADVNQLMIRGTIRRQLPNNWFFVSSPIITANWKAPSSQRWSIPLGGGIGKTFRLANKPWAWSVQAYANVIRPDAAPHWTARLAITAAIPVPRD